MSVQGKNGRNIRKLAVSESNVPSVGFKKVRALHEASAGDTIIDLTSLNAPSDAVANGYLAPTVADLTKVNLKQFKNNVTIRTGTGQLIQDIDFVINGATTIRLLVPALDLQVFEIIIDASPRTGNTLVDSRPLVSTGTLAADTTDYNVGEPFEVGKFPSQQVGAIVVFVDGQQMYRNVGNQPDGEGDYYEVHAGAGLGTLIRFNTTDSEDRQVVVLSIAALADRPDGSLEALVQTLQGQIDNHREILEAVTGSTIAPGAPNDVDLKAFGDRVLNIEGQLIEGTNSVSGFQKRNKYQTKILSTVVTTDGVVAELTFNNLVIGKKYEITGNFTLGVNAGADNAEIVVEHLNGAQQVHRSRIELNQDGSSTPDNINCGISYKFTATATTLTFVASSATASSRIIGVGARSGTYVQIEERNDLDDTTDFS